MTLWIMSVFWLAYAIFEAFVRNDQTNSNTGVIICMICFVGAKIIGAITKLRGDDEPGVVGRTERER